MTTSYPTGYDALTNPTTGDQLLSPSHTVQHANANDAIEALEHALGNSTVGGKLWTGHFYIPASALLPTLSNGANGFATAEIGASNKMNYAFMDYLAGVQSRAEVDWAMPDDWDGSTITGKFHWTPSTTDTGLVTWQLSARCFGDNDTLDANSGTAVTVDDAGIGTLNRAQVSAATAAVTVAGPGSGGEAVHFRVSRRGDTDAFTGTARLRGVMITYGRA